MTARAGAALVLLVSVASAGCGASGPAPAPEPGRPLLSDLPAIKLGEFQNQARPGSLRDDRGLLLAGAFSDLYHDPRDGADVFWAVTDRGPTRPSADGTARRFEVPDFDPALLKVLAAPGGVVVLRQLPILTLAGRSVSGLPNRARAGEAIVGPDGEPLRADPGGLDPRGLVRLADGTFWLADTNGPSVVHLTADGRVLERWLPRGAGLPDAGYPTAEALPAVLGGAALESLAATAEGRYLYTATSGPDAAGGGLVRLLALDTLMARAVGEWVYALEAKEARLSALAFVDAGRLLAVETTVI